MLGYWLVGWGGGGRRESLGGMVQEVVLVVAVEVGGRVVGKEDEAVECRFVIFDVEAEVGGFEIAPVNGDLAIGAASGLVVGLVSSC